MPFEAPVVVSAAGAWAARSVARRPRPAITTWKHDTAFLRRPKDLGLSHPTVIGFINLMCPPGSAD
jgi:hypothetical protein